jgi:hypothetical protein
LPKDGQVSIGREFKRRWAFLCPHFPLNPKML